MVTHRVQLVQFERLRRKTAVPERVSILKEYREWLFQYLWHKSANSRFFDFKNPYLTGQLVVVFAIAVAMFSNTASANFAYNYLQVSYVFGEYEFARGDVSYDGIEVSAQYEVFPSIAIGINYLSIEGDDTETSIAGQNTFTYEADGVEAYVLYYSPVTPQADFLLGARIDMREFLAQLQGSDPDLQTEDDTNYLSTGLRYQLNGLEIYGQWFYQLDAEDGEDSWSYRLGLLSGNPGMWQLGFSVDSDDAGGFMRAFLRRGF